MATKKQKEQLVRTIKNPERYFKVDFGRYGGEVAMPEKYQLSAAESGGAAPGVGSAIWRKKCEIRECP